MKPFFSDAADVSHGRTLTVLLAACLPFLAFAVQGHMGFSLWDEGFLWYGAQRVTAGEVPIRDFMAYDPARYYWAAGFMTLLGSKGIVALRLSNIVLEGFAIGLAAYLVTRPQPRAAFGFGLLAAATFLLWMIAYFKAADYAASVFVVFALAYLLERPEAKRYFICGAAVGLVAIIGRNHGVYGAVASILAILYLAYRREGIGLPRAAGAWAAGVFAGYSPLLVALLVTPGFPAAFLNGIEFQFQYGATNLPLPVPWPWLAIAHDIPRRLLPLGLLFLALPLFWVAALIWIFLRGREWRASANAVFLAATFAAIPYTHYAFARADITHLSFSIFPFLIGVLTFPPIAALRVRYAVAAALLLAAGLVALPEQPAVQAAMAGDWRDVDVDGDRLRVKPEIADEVSFITELSRRYTPDGQAFLVAPFWPGAYALLERKAPVWEIYALFPRSESFQEAELQRLISARPGFVVLSDEVLDKRRDLLYGSTHPLIDRYIRSAFRPVTEPEAPPHVRAYAPAVAVSGDAGQ